MLGFLKAIVLQIIILGSSSFSCHFTFVVVTVWCSANWRKIIKLLEKNSIKQISAAITLMIQENFSILYNKVKVNSYYVIKTLFISWPKVLWNCDSCIGNFSKLDHPFADKWGGSVTTLDLIKTQGSQHVEIMSRGNHERSPYLAYFLRCTRTIELSWPFMTTNEDSTAS